MDKIEEDIIIVNPLGLHARPAATLVKTALTFQSDIHASVNGHLVNAKSIMGLLTLAAGQGAQVTVICQGEDAQEAMEAIRSLIESGFGEM